MKKWISGLVAMALLGSSALASVYEGSVIAADAQQITAQASGTVEEISVEVGSIVQEGQALATLKRVKVYAEQDGLVSSVEAKQGTAIAGTVLNVAPETRYTIYCTVDEAYQSVASTLVHSGETLYIKCTSDGSHRASGIVGAIEGDEFRVWATAGELYIGETVYLYRSDEFKSEARVGIGTVVSTDNEAYDASGYLLSVHVAEGDTVERGQLLYEYIETDYGGAVDARITSPKTAVVTELAVKQGDRVEQGQSVATIAPIDSFCIEASVEEADAARLEPGATVSMIFAADPAEQPCAGTVLSVGGIAENGTYPVRIVPTENINLRLGMTVSLYFE